MANPDAYFCTPRPTGHRGRRGRFASDRGGVKKLLKYSIPLLLDAVDWSVRHYRQNAFSPLAALVSDAPSSRQQHMLQLTLLVDSTTLELPACPVILLV